MKRANLIALLLALVVMPVLVMAYIPFLKDLRRNVAKHEGEDIVNRLEWYRKEFGKASPSLSQAFVPVEDRTDGVAYRVFPDDTTHFQFVVYVGKNDSVIYDNASGGWQ